MRHIMRTAARRGNSAAGDSAAGGEDVTQTVTPRTPQAAAARIGGAAEVLTEEQVRAFVHEQLDKADLDGRSVCVLVPDGTRSCPMPMLLSAAHEALHGRVSRLTVLVALGTHAEMSEPALAEHLGYPGGALAERYPATTVLNHAWWDPDTFATVGTIPAEASPAATSTCSPGCPVRS
jgi:nickel-dependent lactate racemase